MLFKKYNYTLVLCCSFRVFYRIGPPQNIHKIDFTRDFGGAGSPFPVDPDVGNEDSGDMEFRKFKGRTKGNGNGHVKR